MSDFFNVSIKGGTGANNFKNIRSVQLIKGGYTIKQGENFTLGFKLLDENGIVIIPTGKTIGVKIANKNGVVYETIASMVGDHIEFSVNEDIGYGQMHIELKVTEGTTFIQKYPADGWIVLKITPSLDDLGVGGINAVTAIQMFSDIAAIETIAGNADTKSTIAKSKAEATATQLATIIIENGTSDVEILAARTDGNTAESFPTVGVRLDTVTSQLVEKTNLLKNQLSVLNFTSSVTNNDWSNALMAAHDALPIDGGVIVVPSAVTIKKAVIFQKRVHLKGVGYSHSESTSPPSTIVKDGNFTGLTFLGWNSFIENIDVNGVTGNGGDGINVVGSRMGMRNVSVRNQGGNGIRVGRASGDNTNGWNFTNLFTVKNGLDGIHLHYGEDGNSAIPDLSAGILSGIDTRDNGRDGIHIGNTLNNTFLGVMSQHNGRHGVYLGANATGNYFFNPYAELNLAGNDKEFLLDVNSKQNVVLGQRSRIVYDSITDNGTANLVLTTNPGISGNPYYIKSSLALREMKVSNRNISGDWNFTQSDNRDLLIELLGTSVGAKVMLKKVGAPLQLEVDRLSFAGTKYMDNLISDSRTLNTTNIPANSTVEIAIALVGARTTDMVTCTPRGQMPAGLMWQSYIFTDGVVTLRLANVTGALINGQNIGFKTTVIGTSL